MDKIVNNGYFAFILWILGYLWTFCFGYARTRPRTRVNARIRA